MDGDPYEFEPLILEHARRVAELIDRVCEQSLLTGRYGVRLTHRIDLERNEMTMTAEVCTEVPYGRIEEVWL